MSRGAAPTVLARGLTKSYPGVAEPAVRGLDLTIEPGEMFGFLGPNGAGKSTTMQMLATILDRTGGTLEVLGHDPRTARREIQRRIAVVPQEIDLDVQLGVRDNLEMHARYCGVGGAAARRRADEALELLGLAARARAPIDELSGGAKRRLLIARALLTEPELMVMDEPTVALDPDARRAVWAVLRRLNADGTTIVLSTHYMEEAAELFGRVLVMSDGGSIALGSPAEVISECVSPYVVELRGPDLDTVEEAVRTSPDLAEETVLRDDDRVLVYTDRADHVQRRLGVGEMPAATSTLRRETSLEDVFLNLARPDADEEPR